MTRPKDPPGVQLIGRGLLDQVRQEAEASPRQRMNYNFHATPEENPNRLLNVLIRGTYIAPHRHLDPPKAEAFLVLEGEVAFFIFDDLGHVTARYRMGTDPGRPELSPGIDLAPGVWHTLAAITPHATCYEVKPGPYLPANDKAFATWAPREGDPGTAAYLASLLDDLPNG
jgi:cupin fold WbuC family metalloprotein